MLLTIKVSHDRKHWVVLKLDTTAHKLTVLESKIDCYLDNIISHCSYDEFIRLLSNRCGGDKSLSELLETIRWNGMKSVKDKLLFEIMED